MNPSGSGRGPWFGHGWTRNLLLALVVGVALGALLVGPVSGMWRAYANDGRGGYAPSAGARGGFGPGAGARGDRRQAEQAVPPAGAAQAAPRADTVPSLPWADARGGRDAGGAHEGAGPRGRGGAFFPFAGLELLAPLLLIGMGVWLLIGRRRGPSSRGGSPAAQRSQAGPPAAPVDQPRDATTPEPSATGETRWL